MIGPNRDTILDAIGQFNVCSISWRITKLEKLTLSKLRLSRTCERLLKLVLVDGVESCLVEPDSPMAVMSCSVLIKRYCLELQEQPWTTSSSMSAYKADNISSIAD